MILSDRFLGYKRENGSIGVRNYVGVLACSACAVPAARRISEAVNGTALFTHNQGCCAADADLEATRRTLVSLALNPNLHSVLFVALGCEGLPVEQIVEETCLAGKHAELISVENCGGTSLAVAQGTFRAEEMVVEASRAERCEASLSDLTIGIKCGDSDAISGLGANRVVGHVVDSLVAKGCTCLVTEVTELIGAEHVLARRAVDAIVSENRRCCRDYGAASRCPRCPSSERGRIDRGCVGRPYHNRGEVVGRSDKDRHLPCLRRVSVRRKSHG